MSDRTELTRLLALFRQKVERRQAAVLAGESGKAKLAETDLELVAADLGNLFDLDALAAELESSSDYRVLRRLPLIDRYCEVGGDSHVGLVVDVETTGTDFLRDRITEASFVPFWYDADGNVSAVGAGYCGFEDPGIPIPAEITAITGITDDDVRGLHLDDHVIDALAASADLVIAHHADFDRKFVEERFPIFREHAWACSYREVDWPAYGAACAKLPHLLLEVCGVFYDAHRADVDCRAVIHLLATARREGRTALAELLASATQPSYRVSAAGAPYDVKDLLKQRRYRWNAGAKVWFTDIRATDLEAERAWLAEYAHCRRPLVDQVSATDRYSTRVAA